MPYLPERILITGGTGSFGRHMLNHLLSIYPSIKRIVIYSRDELKQWEMQQLVSEEKQDVLRFFLGDVRDLTRLSRALNGIDTVIHAAALKQVPAAEYNPSEFIKTNILGAENVIQASLSNNVKRVVALSTDKASAPVNLYGATKLCSDKLFIAANNIKGTQDIKFTVVRYGNVMGSRGSVIPLFMSQCKNGKLSITDKNMTRFNITLEDSVKLVQWAIENTCGGEILVPKIPSYNIVDLANAISPSSLLEEIGIRPGEKLHEEMITTSDSPYTYDIGDYYSIVADKKYIESRSNRSIQYKLVPYGFKYNSQDNPHFLTVEELRSLIIKHISPEFSPC